MSSGVRELQKYTAVSKYARFVEELQRRETWEETVGRYRGMLQEKYPDRTFPIAADCEAVEKFEVMPSMRGLQFGGPPIFKHNGRLYNCAGSCLDRLRFFGEAFYLLLCGSGVGFSVQGRHLQHLPGFSKKRLAGVKLPKKKFKPADTIEGWADTANVMMSAYHAEPVVGFEDYHECEPSFDYTGIRAEGSKLSFGIGRAPGPLPLRNANERVRRLLHRAVAEGLERLDSLTAYDAMMHYSDAVISGGVRRSATIVLFDLWDQLMLLAKTGNWRATNPQRGRSNNSAILLRGQVKFEDFQKLFEATRQFGEPGFYWVDHPDGIPNPCFRGSTRLATSEGMVRVDELYRRGTPNRVVGDYRVGAGDKLRPDSLGTTMRDATRVELTQKSADIYRLTTEHGHSVEATDNHEFPTLRGRLKLRDIRPGDVLMLQSGEGRFGTAGTYSQGLLLGLLTGDGCVHDGEAFIDLWEDDFGDCDTIRASINEEVAKVPLLNGGRGYGKDVGWVAQRGGNVAKRRIGGVRLYRALQGLLGGACPGTAKDRVPECVWQGSREFVRGYLHGIFHSDGSVQCQHRGTQTSLNLRLTQANRDLLADVQILLQNFGVVSRLYARGRAGKRLLPDGRGGTALYECREVFELVVNRPNLARFMRSVRLFGRKDRLAQDLLDSVGWNSRKPERFQTRVVTIEWAAKEDVYCLYEPKTNSVVANGIVAGNCVEIGFWPFLAAERETPETAGLLAGYRGPVRQEGGKVVLSGWQMCNLTTINAKTLPADRPAKDEEFLRRCEIASRLGTWQAGFAHFPYLGPVSEAIVRKEALLGVSIAGVMHHPDALLDPEVLRAGASAGSCWPTRARPVPSASTRRPGPRA
jgi:hypothetical protein